MLFPPAKHGRTHRLIRSARYGLALLAAILVLEWIGPLEKASADQARSAPTDLGGNGFDPLRAVTNQAVVLIFLSVDCPVCGRYAPEIRRLRTEFTSKGIAFWLVFPNLDESAADIQRYAKDFALGANLLRDPGHMLVTRSKAKVTPQAALFLRDGQLVYSGRIDDRQAAFGQTRVAPQRKDLERALRAATESKPVPKDWQPAVGCSIPELSGSKK